MTLDDLRGRTTIGMRELQDVLGVGRNAAYAAVREGVVPSIRVGTAIRIPVPALLAVLGVTDDSRRRSA